MILEAVRSSKTPDFQAAGYMVLSAMASKATLSPAAVSSNPYTLLPRYPLTPTLPCLGIPCLCIL